MKDTEWFKLNFDALTTTNDHDLSGIAYDLNGNIKTLNRRGMDDEGHAPALWDDLAYTYSGNQLMKVVENAQASPHKDFGFRDGGNTGDDYRYDRNGNMARDNNKGITSITYNHLNLPTVITVDNGAQSGTVTYVYDAEQHLSKTTTKPRQCLRIGVI